MLIAAPASGGNTHSSLSCPTTATQRQPVCGPHPSPHTRVGRRHRAMLAGTALLLAALMMLAADMIASLALAGRLRGPRSGVTAMGATQAQMRRIFLLQGGIVGFFGSLLGSALAWSFLMLWQLLARNPDGTPMFVIGVEPGLVAMAAGGASLVGILSALLPARRAAQLDPVVAIRG